MEAEKVYPQETFDVEILLDKSSFKFEVIYSPTSRYDKPYVRDIEEMAFDKLFERIKVEGVYKISRKRERPVQDKEKEKLRRLV